MLDFKKQGYLDAFVINYFFREICEKMAAMGHEPVNPADVKVRAPRDTWHAHALAPHAKTPSQADAHACTRTHVCSRRRHLRTPHAVLVPLPLQDSPLVSTPPTPTPTPIPRRIFSL
jgi:hypothetical protein